MKPQFLVHDRRDNVGVVVADIHQGDKLLGCFLDCGGQLTVDAVDAIPLGHKVALREITLGADVIKFGVPVGLAIRPVIAGQHVHIHNIKSKRW